MLWNSNRSCLSAKQNHKQREGIRIRCRATMKAKDLMSLAASPQSDKHRRVDAIYAKRAEILYNNFRPRCAEQKLYAAKGKFDVRSENSPSCRSPGN
jgi:hypothetical protein